VPDFLHAPPLSGPIARFALPRMPGVIGSYNKLKLFIFFKGKLVSGGITILLRFPWIPVDPMPV
jgi:hypothetical protein